MHLLAITLGDSQLASTRIRLLNYLPFLRESGWKITICEPVPRTYIKRLLEVFKLGQLARHSDVVLIQKRLFPVWVIRYLRQNAHRLVFEIDDPIFLDAETGIINPIVEKRLALQLKVADAVIVDNPSLAEYCRDFNPSVDVLVACVETELYKPAKVTIAMDSFVIGWVGSLSTLIYLDQVEQPLQALYERYGTRLTIKIVSAEPYFSTRFPVTNK